MHKITKTLCLSSCLIAAPAFSWGFEGHEYIGELTYAYLTPEAREWVDERLALVDEPSLAEATTWADRIRGTDLGQELAPLHYANLPPDEDNLDMARDCPERRCVVGAMLDSLAIMQDSEASKQEQAEAFRAFTHWHTDMHQPLHMGHGEDRGGNDITVYFFGFETNLHRLWDTDMIRGMEQPAPTELAAEQPLPEQHTSNWERAIVRWAEQANRLAREYAYAEVADGERLGEEYFRQARPIIEQQLLRSGQRMALILNAIASASAES